MNSSSKHVILSIDEDLIIDEILINNAKNLKIHTGLSITSFIHNNYRETFINECKNPEMKGNFQKLKLINGDDVFLFKLNINKIIFFILGFDKISSNLFDEIMKINNDQINEIRNLKKQLLQDTNTQNHLKEMMKLNSELINTRRELSQKNHELEIINFTDYLTKLNNRRKFFSDVYKFVSEKEYNLLMMDFNNFKIINDLFGHDKGDEVLIQFSDLLKEHFSPYNGTPYRLGGDEFAVLVSVISEKEIKEIFQKIDMTLQKLHPDIGIAYGCVKINKENCNLDHKVEISMHEADKKMYIMKGKSKRR